MYSYVYVITPFGVVLMVYPPDSPRADKPQHHDKRMFITVDWSLLGNPCARVRGAVIFSKKGMQPSDPGQPCA